MAGRVRPATSASEDFSTKNSVLAERQQSGNYYGRFGHAAATQRVKTNGTRQWILWAELLLTEDDYKKCSHICAHVDILTFNNQATMRLSEVSLDSVSESKNFFLLPCCRQVCGESIGSLGINDQLGKIKKLSPFHPQLFPVVPKSQIFTLTFCIKCDLKSYPQTCY
jgi:hypothetical protein